MFRRGRSNSTSDSPDAVLYFNNTQHSVDIGPTYTFEGGEDSLFVGYSYTAGETKPEGPGATTSYTFQTIAPEYVTKSLVPSWTLTINGGVTLVDQLGSTHSFISGKLGLATDYDRRTHVQMLVERRAIPSYYATGSTLISNLAQFNVTYGVTRLVRLTAGAYYAYNEAAPVKTFASRTARGLWHSIIT